MSRENLKNLSVTVPYVPNTGVDGVLYAPNRFSREVFDVEKRLSDHELTEIVGSHKSLIDGEWVEIGWKFIFSPKEEQPL